MVKLEISYSKKQVNCKKLNGMTATVIHTNLRLSDSWHHPIKKVTPNN